ncbi:MAG: aminotransferase class V-fold PLP-dependent enzyme [Bryobacterales bacterium]|nr:aminotransferase class V-fold PLP-dependent enzyme [Bryobacterales bacterium]
MQKRLSRRRMLYSAGLPLAAQAVQAAGSPAPSVYSRLGVRTVINAYGTVTTLGGAILHPEVKRAMDEASRHFVAIHELQKKAGERLAELTGAESGFVTCGAAAALCLATCAVTAGADPVKMNRLPDLTGMKSEIVIQKAHRNGYDHAFRMVGVHLVEGVTADDVRRSINEKTAALAMVISHGLPGGKVDLAEMISIAHSAGVPLILDAAAEIPPADNMRKFIKMGADLVAFSGGKELRGPQCSGMLLGRKTLIEAAYANSSPNSHLARIAKVGKEEIAGLVTAVEVALRKDETAERRHREEMLSRVAARVSGIPTVKTEFIPNLDPSHSPRLSVQWDEAKLGLSVKEMVKRLHDSEPSIAAADMAHFQPAWKGLGIFANELQAGEEMIVARRVHEILSEKAKS